MRVVFMGTPEFAVPSLENLLIKHEVIAVITQPDKPKGRGKKIQFTPVKETALKHNLPVLQPLKIRDIKEELQSYNADIFCVVAYGQLLPRDILDIPKLGCINVHGSLLPKYRGAAPINWAILNGETTTGITIMYLDQGMDSGDMILKREIPILPEDTSATVYESLSQIGGKALVEAVDLLGAGTAEKTQQDHQNATYAPMLTKELGLIDWNNSSQEIVNKIRGLNPWPCAYTYYNLNMLKIWKATPIAYTEPGAPGTVTEVTKDKICVKTGDGAISIDELQLQGGKCLKVADFLRGNKIQAGEKFVQRSD